MPTEGEWRIEGLDILDENGEIVAECNDGLWSYSGETNARRIVTAVNCHEELVGLVEECSMELRRWSGFADFATTRDMDEIRGRLDAVLAKAMEGEG